MNQDNRIDAALIDIDGVICKTDYCPTPEEFNWGKFVAANHEPIVAGVQLVQGFINVGLYPIFLTARPEHMREQTEAMLADLGFHGVLYMAPNEAIDKDCYVDYQSSQMVEKKKALVNLQKKYNFVYAIDDQEPNVQMFKEYGIPTLKAVFV